MEKKRLHDSAARLPALPRCWSDLTWQQLCQVWRAKLRYGGNPAVARVAALIALCGLSACEGHHGDDTATGERRYALRGADGRLWAATPRQLAHLASEALPWLDYPYGDPGEDAVKDDRGKVVKERREPVMGYVNPGWRDAMSLPEETVEVDGVVFSLPQLAINNLTWEQYRSVQPLVPMLFREGVTEGEAAQLQAQFVAHCLVPEQVQTEPSQDRFRPEHTFKYDNERAEQSVGFWKRQIEQGSVMYHICFQVYQTAVQYYSVVYPLLFNGGGGGDPLRDALTGEVNTLNAVMRYAKYTDQQKVYESNVPFVLDILNAMAKEAKEIEKINSRIKKK